MPHIPKAQSDWPGFVPNMICGDINVHVEGGSIDGPFSMMDYRGLRLDEAEIPSFKVAVRLSDGHVLPVVLLEEWIREEKTFEESKRYAQALAKSWRIEVYTFDRWQKPEKKHRYSLPRKAKATYRFFKAYNLVPKAGDHRWMLTIGGQTEIGDGGRNVLPTQDRWDTACAEVEAAADSFHRIVSLFPEDIYQGHFEGPKRAVEISRTEARRVAALGQHLDGISDPTAELDETIAQTLGQLEALRAQVVEAVKLISQVQLEIPEIFPNALKEIGTDTLEGLRHASRELSGS